MLTVSRFCVGPSCIVGCLLAASVACMSGPSAQAQVSPAKLYNTVNRPAMVSIARPTSGPREGDATLQLLDPATNKTLASASVELPPAASGTGAKPFDLALVFGPEWWSKLARSPAYLQLFIGDTPVGPATFIQPMNSPARASLDARSPRLPLVVFPASKQPSPKVYTGVRLYSDKLVEIVTEFGSMTFALRPDLAPNTAWNFRHLAEGGFFDSSAFHRVVAAGSVAGRGFVVQGGDPSDAEPFDGGPGYGIQMEPTDLKHDYGVLSMARDTDPDTAGSQFFICLTREETARLDGQYAAFGQLLATPGSLIGTAKPSADGPDASDDLSGVAVLQRIASTLLKPTVAPVGAPGATPPPSDRPINPPKVQTIRLVDAPPRPLMPPVATLGKPGADR